MYLDKTNESGEKKKTMMSEALNYRVITKKKSLLWRNKYK